MMALSDYSTIPYVMKGSPNNGAFPATLTSLTSHMKKQICNFPCGKYIMQDRIVCLSHIDREIWGVLTCRMKIRDSHVSSHSHKWCLSSFA